LARQVHQRWIIDFKVDIQLRDSQWVHLYTARDPIGAATVGAALYPAARKKSRVTCEQVQHFLRDSFAQYGLPREIQTDWESALHAQPGDNFPSRFTLWLVGLGITHLHARPGTPTDDAEVERAHQTVYAYAIADYLDWPLSALQQHLGLACQELNCEYPSRAHGCQVQPPVVAHPELLHPPRPFDPQHELAEFDLTRVDAYLATFRFERKVGKTGQISLGWHDTRYGLGRGWAGQTIQIHFDPADRCFVARSQEQEFARWPAKHLAVEDIVGFSAATPCPCPQQLPLPLLFQESIIDEFLEV
jgi:transposase InsO family protein